MLRSVFKSHCKRVFKCTLYLILLAPIAFTSIAVSKEISGSPAQLFIGLLGSYQTSSHINVIDSYAKMFQMKEVPEDYLLPLNAKKAYMAKSEYGVIFFSYNDDVPISVSVENNFDAEEVVKDLSQYVRLIHKGGATRLGQRTEFKQMFDGDESIGFVALSYGVADSIKGTGTLAYFSELPK